MISHVQTDGVIMVIPKIVSNIMCVRMEFQPEWYVKKVMRLNELIELITYDQLFRATDD